MHLNVCTYICIHIIHTHILKCVTLRIYVNICNVYTYFFHFESYRSDLRMPRFCSWCERIANVGYRSFTCLHINVGIYTSISVCVHISPVIPCFHCFIFSPSFFACVTYINIYIFAL